MHKIIWSHWYIKYAKEWLIKFCFLAGFILFVLNLKKEHYKVQFSLVIMFVISFCHFYEIKCTCSISIQSFKKKNHVGFVVCVLFERVYVKKTSRAFSLRFPKIDWNKHCMQTLLSVQEVLWIMLNCFVKQKQKKDSAFSINEDITFLCNLLVWLKDALSSNANSELSSLLLVWLDPCDFADCCHPITPHYADLVRRTHLVSKLLAWDDVYCF